LLLSSLRSFNGENDSSKSNKVHPISSPPPSSDDNDSISNSNSANGRNGNATVFNHHMYFSDEHIMYIERLIAVSARQSSLCSCLCLFEEKKISTNFILNSDGI
jgi:hypothetical protein